MTPASASERGCAPRPENPDDGAVEFAVTCHAPTTCLPAGTRVFDLRGGPGRYTRWLAERGHRVVQTDLSPARALVASIVEADARDLSRWADGAFDAVLALGPFHHLTQSRIGTAPRAN
ncbi:MAG TPA: class I SAM-dependent methyltransferase [Thermomicrobiales bacterium]|jgi:hypothetical protein